MNGGDILSLITVFVLAAFVGFEVISKVPSVLHTPLMSGTNAIHGVVLVGSMIVLGEGHGALQLILGFLAVVLATLNVVGGFTVTDRMLEMFKGRQSPSRPARAAAVAPAAVQPAAAGDTAPAAGPPAGAAPAAAPPAGAAPAAGPPAGAAPAGDTSPLPPRGDSTGPGAQ